MEVYTFIKYRDSEVMVACSGVGISPANLEKLFRMDEKIQSEGTNNEKGIGLGLILFKEFVEKNNGKIWAESLEGTGSWFTFTIPGMPESSNLKKNAQMLSTKDSEVKA